MRLNIKKYKKIHVVVRDPELNKSKTITVYDSSLEEIVEFIKSSIENSAAA